jgi:hypothetical protein
MISSTLAVYLIMNSLFQWDFSHVVHINGFNSREECERMSREIQANNRPGDLRVICRKDEGSEA